MSKPKYTYFLDNFTSSGLPANLNYDPNGLEGNTDLKKTISQDLLDEITENLPERVRLPNTKPEWLKNTDIHIVDDCEIEVTFLDEGAGYRNGIGYYIYDTNKPPRKEDDIKVLYVLFPNYSKSGAGGELVAGDTLRLASTFETTTKNNQHIVTPTSYTFTAGQSIGFVLFVNAFRTYKNSMNHWANGRGRKYYSNPDLNPENQSINRFHTVAVKSTQEVDGFLLGFEDLYRPHGDDDFNDAVMLVKCTPFEAIDDGPINYTSELSGKGTILCDDMIGDFDYTNNDYSDNIHEYSYNITYVNGNISEIVMDFHLKHRSTLFDHEFGIEIPNLNTTDHTIQRELFIGNGSSTVETISANGDDVTVFPSTRTALPPSSNHSDYANTHPGWEADPTPVSSCRIKITFNVTIDKSTFGVVQAPYKPYLKVYKSKEAGVGPYYNVRFETRYYSNTRLSDLRQTKPSGVMKIVVLKDVVDYQCSHEYITMIECYPELYSYLKSDGLNDKDWWRYSRPQYLNPLLAVPERTWSI